MALETKTALLAHIRNLQERLDEAEETLRALRRGEVDAVVASGPDGDRVYTLKGADEAYRVMVENMAEGALTLTLDGLILFSNQQFASMLGIPLERVIGSSVHDFIAAEDASMLSALLGCSTDSKAEVRFKRAPAGLVPAQLSANTLSLGGTKCICFIATDLSEQKRNEEIVAAERLARSILEQAAGAILVVDSTGRIIRASRAAEQIAGGSVLLREFDNVFRLRADSENKEYTLGELLTLVQQSGSVAGLKATARMPDGRILDVMVSAGLLTGTNSECLGCIVLLSDVSVLTRAEEAVRQLSEQRRMALEAGKLGAWELRFDTGDVAFDERCRDMFGIPFGDHMACAEVTAKIHDDDREAAWAGVRHAIAGVNGGTYYGEYRVVWPDGSVHWVASHGQGFFEGQGNQRHAVRFVGVNQEITERKQAEEARQENVRALESAVREKTVLLKEIHHRVKNNLAVISSLLSMKADSAGSSEARVALDESQQRVRSMALIHEHLYGSSHLDRINFSDYAEALTHGLTSAFVDEPGRISIEMDVEPIEIGIERAVPCGLILNELLSNAFKYAFPGGREGKIRISFHKSQPGSLELTIEDNGIGLPAGRLADPNTKSLGLRIVGILAHQLNGSLEQQPCSGTRILLRLPEASLPRLS